MEPELIAPNKAVFAAMVLPSPDLTLRQAVEWYKGVLRLAESAGPMTSNDFELMNARWGEVCSFIAKREGVPAGYISYMLAELVQQELAVLVSAEIEAAEAMPPKEGK